MVFKINELLKATKGRLISGKINTNVLGISIDSRTIKPQEAFIAIKGSNFDGHNFIDEAIKKGAKAVIIQSSFSHHSVIIQSSGNISFIEVKDTIRALGDIVQFQRKKFDIPIIVLTGSNGKTTTKEMIAWILSKKFKVLKNEGTKNNRIGLPLTLLNLNDSHDVAVLEAGTNHPGEIEYLARISQPNIGIITNIGPSHLECLKNLKGVFREKYTLIKHLKNPCIAILNADDGLLKRKVVRKNKKPIIFGFGIKNRSDFFASDVKIFNGKIEFLVNPVRNIESIEMQNKISNGVNQKHKVSLKTLGHYNIYNALAAITVGRLFGMEYKDIASRLATFNYPQNRLILIELNNIKFINDTYNSNPTSLKQALDVLDNFRTIGRKIFVMGDMLELGDSKESFHRQAGKAAAKICDVFITVGKLSKFAACAAKLCGFESKNIFICQSNQQARDILFKKISPRPNDIVLIKGSRAMMMGEILRKT